MAKLHNYSKDVDLSDAATSFGKATGRYIFIIIGSLLISMLWNYQIIYKFPIKVDYRLDFLVLGNFLYCLRIIRTIIFASKEELDK